MAIELRGAPVASAITADLKIRADKLISSGIQPTLAIIRVGEHEGDMVYERGAIRRCEQTGIRVLHHHLPESCSEDEILEIIDAVNNDSTTHGCLVLRPLPEHIDERRVCESLIPKKDVDCITSHSLDTVFIGEGEGFAPCTAQSCLEILDHYGCDVAGKRVAVIGRSLVIGRPISMMLQARNATVTMCHSKTVNMAEICREADVLVVAAGHSGVVDASYTNPNQFILDVGINAAPDGGIIGDVIYDSVADKVEAISPVPGGVGSVTTAVLCKHVIEAAEAVDCH